MFTYKLAVYIKEENLKIEHKTKFLQNFGSMENQAGSYQSGIMDLLLLTSVFHVL